MDQAKRDSQETGTDPVPTAADCASYMFSQIAARRRSPMITPRGVAGVTVTGTDNTSGIPRANLDLIFQRMLVPFSHPSVNWFVMADTGVPLEFIRWAPGILMGRITVVVPELLRDLAPEVKSTVENVEQRTSQVWVELRELRAKDSPVANAQRWMVNRSHFVAAFPHEYTASWETVYGVNHADSIGLPHLVWPVSDR